jgi:hypothetical protein
MLIVLGKWARKQQAGIDNAVGVAGIAVGLALLEMWDERLSKGFAALILISLATLHGPPIVRAAGLVK